MGGQEVYLSNRPSIDFDDKIASATATKGTNGTKLTFSDTSATNFRTRTGRRAFLTFVGNAVSSGGDNFITFHLYVNGNLIAQPPFNSFTQAVGETYNGWSRNVVRIPLPQNAMIEVLVDNSDAANDYTAYARLRVEYEDL